MLEEDIDIRNRIIALYCSNNTSNFELAEVLESSMGIDLSDMREEAYSLRSGQFYTVAEAIKARNIQINNAYWFSGKLDLRNRKREKITSYPALLLYMFAQEATNASLSGNAFRVFPEELRQFKKLIFLDLSHNAITEIPEWIDELADLETIYLRYNRIETLPESLFRLPKLKYLHIDGNPLELPDEGWGRLANSLRELSISDIPAFRLPSDLRFCKNLKWLNINGMGLEELPAWLANLPLTHLSAQNNRLTELPKMPYQWRLEYLDIAHNNLAILEDRRIFDAIEQSLAAHEQFSTTYFPFLEDKNEAFWLKNDFTYPEFRGLKYLFIDNNQIRYLPKWLANCEMLDYFSANYNPLKMGTLAYLGIGIRSYTSLYLRHCGLKTIPVELFRLWGRKFYCRVLMHLQGNPIEYLPELPTDISPSESNIHVYLYGTHLNKIQMPKGYRVLE